jgi:hypothetical protein
MKFFKALVILLILVLNQTVSTYELSKRFGMKYKALSAKKKSTFTKSRGKTSFSFSRRSNKNKSNHSNTAVVSTRARVTPVGLILSAVQKVLSIVNSGANVLKHIVYTKIMNVAKAEYIANQNFIDYVKDQEIQNCETIKIMMETNKYFFFQAELKAIFVDSMIQSKTVEEITLGTKLDLLSNTQLTSDQLKEKELIPSKIKLIKEEKESLQLFKEILSHVNIASSDVLNTLGIIEDRVCDQGIYYKAFDERNNQLKEEIIKIQKKIQQNPNGVAGYIFSTASDVFGNAIIKNKDVTNHNFDFSGNKDPTTTPIDSITEKFSNSLNGVSYGVQAVENLVEIKELWSELKDKKTKGETVAGWLLIASKGLAFIGNAMNAVNSWVDSAEVALAASVIASVGKLIELIVLIYKYVKKKSLGNLHKMLTGILTFLGSLVAIAISPFNGIISEVISLISNLFELYRAFKQLKKQQREANYFQILRQSKHSQRQNFVDYNICYASYISNQSIFDILIKIHQFDSKIDHEGKSTQSGDSNLTNKILDSVVTYGSNNGIELNIKDIIKNICKKYHNICMRSFDDEDFTKFGFTSLEIQHYKDLSLYGPFTDFIVTSSEESISTLIKHGYEIISDKLLGCRMCSHDKLVRHVQIMSDKFALNHDLDYYINNKTDLRYFKKEHDLINENLMKGLFPQIDQKLNLFFTPICQVLYQDRECQTLHFKKFRMSKDYYLVYETISVDLSKTDYYYAANKILLSNTYSKNNFWRSTATLGKWDSDKQEWMDNFSSGMSIFPEHLGSGLNINFGTHSPIKKGDSIRTGIYNYQNIIKHTDIKNFDNKYVLTNSIPMLFYGFGSYAGRVYTSSIKTEIKLEDNKSIFIFQESDVESSILKNIILKNYAINETDIKTFSVKLPEESGEYESPTMVYKYFQYSPFIKMTQQMIQREAFSCDVYCSTSLHHPYSDRKKCNYKKDLSHHSLITSINGANDTYYEEFWKNMEKFKNNNSYDFLHKNYPYVFGEHQIISDHKLKSYKFHIRILEIKESDETIKNENLTLQFISKNKKDFELRVAKSISLEESMLEETEYKIQIPVKNIDKMLFVVFVEKGNLGQFEDFVEAYSKVGFVLINKIAQKLIITKPLLNDIYYAFILVKPLEGYGMINKSFNKYI